MGFTESDPVCSADSDGGQRLQGRTWTMKLLLTSAGVRNASIRTALVELLGKPIEESTALCIPTAQYGHPAVDPIMVRQFVSGSARSAMTGLGWKSVGV